MNTEPKKILFVVSHYLPGFKNGGPTTSIKNMVDALDAFDSYVVTSNTDFGSDRVYDDIVSRTWNRVGNARVLYIARTFLAFIEMVRHVRSLSPDFIYLKSLFDFRFSIVFLLLKKLRVLGGGLIVVAPSGELYEDQLNFKRPKKNVYLALAKLARLYSSVRWHASTPVESDSIRTVFPSAREESIVVAKNIVARPRATAVRQFADSAHDLPLQIVYLSRIARDKNTAFVFEILAEVSGRVHLDLFGPIEDAAYWNEIAELAASLPGNVSYSYRGVIASSESIAVLPGYDMFFLPSFSENFGHAINEALSVGVPVLISDKTPWRNLQEKGMGWDLSLDNRRAFIEVIEAMASAKASGKALFRPMDIFNSYLSEIEYHRMLADVAQLFATKR